MSSLLDFCLSLSGTNREEQKFPEAATWLVNNEYSKTDIEVKPFPLSSNERLFALCWILDGHNQVDAHLRPLIDTPNGHFSDGSFYVGEKTQVHTHDYIELAYIVDGTFSQKILGRDITFGPGELCLIDKNCLHQDYLTGNDATVIFIGLANDIFHEIMDENNTTGKITSFLQDALLKQKDIQQYLHFKTTAYTSSSMENCIYTLFRELCTNDNASYLICKGLMIRIFHLLSTEYEFSLSKEQRKTMNWLIYQDIASFIENNYVTITIHDLVETFHFQEDYFNRLIKSYTGFTYSGYVQDVRLKKACELLSSSKNSIDEIADAVGYHNKGYFYKIFVNRYGMTPNQYRKSQY